MQQPTIDSCRLPPYGYARACISAVVSCCHAVRTRVTNAVNACAQRHRGLPCAGFDAARDTGLQPLFVSACPLDAGESECGRGKVLRCSKCATPLCPATSIVLAAHAPSAAAAAPCSLVFVEPAAWMCGAEASDFPDAVLHRTDDRVLCPNADCGLRLGSWNWVDGARCACGVTCQPAFALSASRVALGVGK